MKASDIKVGQEYAWNSLGWRRYRDENLVKVTVLEPPSMGQVLVRTSKTGSSSVAEKVAVSTRDLVDIWDRVKSRMASAKTSREEALQRQRALDARIKKVLGSQYRKHAAYYEFRVNNDNSYRSIVSGMPRSAFAEILEAAYESGKAAARAEMESAR